MYIPIEPVSIVKQDLFFIKSDNQILCELPIQFIMENILKDIYGVCLQY